MISFCRRCRELVICASHDVVGELCSHGTAEVQLVDLCGYNRYQLTLENSLGFFFSERSHIGQYVLYGKFVGVIRSRC